jgi:Protein of unknown function DUF262
MSLESFVTTIPDLVRRFDKVRVESYQRPYSWGEAHIERLFVDHFMPLVDGTDLDFRGDPFVGTIVLLPKSGGSRIAEIIDGQQRTVTLTMILAHAIRLLSDNVRSKLISSFEGILSEPGKETWLSLRDEDRVSYMAIMNPKFTIEQVRKKMSLDRQVLTTVSGTTSLVKSSLCNRAICSALDLIDDQVQAFLEVSIGKAGITRDAALVRLIEFIRVGLRVVVVKVDSPGQGLAVFEALNTAGLPLTLEQLLKNCLMRVFNDTVQHQLIDASWARFEKAIKDGMRRTRFLLHYYIAHHGPVTAKSAYGCFRTLAEGISKGKNHDGLSSFLDHLEDNWDYYRSIRGPIKTLGGDVCMPGLLAARASLPYAQRDVGVCRVSYALESALIRFQISRRGLGSLRSAITILCGTIRRASIRGIDSKKLEDLVRLELGRIVPGDQLFSESIVAWPKIKMTNRRVILFLRRINHFLRAGGRESLVDLEAFNVGELDPVWAIPFQRHISDEKLSLMGFRSVEEFDVMTSSIGNLIFKPRNGRESSVRVNKGVTRARATAKSLRLRGKWLAATACRVWYF